MKMKGKINKGYIDNLEQICFIARLWVYYNLGNTELALKELKERDEKLKKDLIDTFIGIKNA